MAATAAEDSLYPIAVLIDDLRDDDVAVKLNSIRRLGTIALALGEERARDELLPYLADSRPDEDEVMAALAEQLGELVPSIGGPRFAHALVPLLEGLAGQDETVVRDEAVKALNKVGAHLSTAQALEHIVPCIKRLKGGEWFTSRVSACGLFAVAYPRCDAQTQHELRALFKELCRDDTPMVRRSAAAAVGPLAAAMAPADAQASVLPLAVGLLRDDQESVRKLALESAPEVARALAHDAAAVGDALAAALEVVLDRSWRVRASAAGRMPELAAAFGRAHARQRLLPTFISLLQDAEPDVRVAAAEAVVEFCNELDLPSATVLSELVPPLRGLATDANQNVRAAAATAALHLAPRCGAGDSAAPILDLVMALLKDKVPEVRLNVISNLECAENVFGPEQLTAAVLPAVEELAGDPHWRVRHAVIRRLPLLARALGPELYEARLLPRNREWLCDHVAAIREAAMQALIDIAGHFGLEWAYNKATPMLLEQLNESFYLYRITTMRALPALAKVVTPEALSQLVLPRLLQKAEDAVPNVKFNVCKVLEELAPQLEGAVVAQQVLPVLDMLSEDSDYDVQYFAARAMACYTA